MNKPCTFTLSELLQSDDEIHINAALAKHIQRITIEWLTQKLQEPEEAIKILEFSEKKYPAPLSKQFHKGKIELINELLIELASNLTQQTKEVK
jgi:uncharacterized HAD superfamily protein